ncbi:MAG: Co2+/Mg2+ efflux protein ApaG [Bradymonadia bacterium]
MKTSEATTQGIHIVVQARYIQEQSDPERDFYYFAYHVNIANESTQTAQLISRHWVITDGQNRTQEVKGPGVVGQQPILEPGQSFQYTSACPLPTPVGTMHGTYQMITLDGGSFDAEIAPFVLARPGALH